MCVHTNILRLKVIAAIPILGSMERECPVSSVPRGNEKHSLFLWKMKKKQDSRETGYGLCSESK